MQRNHQDTIVIESADGFQLLCRDDLLVWLGACRAATDVAGLTRPQQEHTVELSP